MRWTPGTVFTTLNFLRNLRCVYICEFKKKRASEIACEIRKCKRSIKNGHKMLECYVTLQWKALRERIAMQIPMLPKIKCCEYGPWSK